jgi:hypothetical protein
MITRAEAQRRRGKKLRTIPRAEAQGRRGRTGVVDSGTWEVGRGKWDVEGWHSFSIGVGVGIGIGIDPCCVPRRILMNSIASLFEFHQHRHDAVGQGILSIPIPIPTPTPSYILASLPDESGTPAGGSGRWEVGSESWIVDSGRWDVGCGMWDVGCGMSVVLRRSSTNREPRTQHPAPNILNIR